MRRFSAMAIAFGSRVRKLRGLHVKKISVQDKTALLVIPASAVTEISYGQDVHRRVGTAVAVGVVTLGLGALTALSKSKKHYVGLTWADGQQKGGLAMQCDKSDYRTCDFAKPHGKGACAADRAE
jgi:hypothetical protein